MQNPSINCPDCGSLTPIDDFGYSTGGTRYHISLCRNCAKNKRMAYKREWDKKHYHEYYQEKKQSDERWSQRRATDRKNLLKKFGITPQEYDEMLIKQNGVCALCGKPETAMGYNSPKTKLLAVDHDHLTGKIRGLLCSKCNMDLGAFEEDTNNYFQRITELKMMVERMETNAMIFTEYIEKYE
jgi:Recombination endonuclease VII